MGNKLFLQQYINTDYCHVFTNLLSLQSSDFYGFGANLYLCLTHYDTAGDKWEHSLTSFDASLTVWWNKGPVTLAYWRKLPGKYLFGQTIGKDENGNALQFEYKPDKHRALGVNWMYMFDKKRYALPIAKPLGGQSFYRRAIHQERRQYDSAHRQLQRRLRLNIPHRPTLAQQQRPRLVATQILTTPSGNSAFQKPKSSYTLVFFLTATNFCRKISLVYIN